MFDTAAYRKDFPILERKVSGYPLVYLDNTATPQTPRQVVEAIDCILGRVRIFNDTK